VEGGDQKNCREFLERNMPKKKKRISQNSNSQKGKKRDGHTAIKTGNIFGHRKHTPPPKDDISPIIGGR